MMTIKKISTLVFLLLSLTSCATILGGGGNQKVTLNSDQPQAHFVVKNQDSNVVVFEGTNPGTLTLERKHKYTVEISLAGYQPQTVYINQNINSCFFGNICLGGLIGMAVDLATGAVWTLDPDTINVRMRIASVQTENGYVVSFITRDDQGQLRVANVTLDKI